MNLYKIDKGVPMPELRRMPRKYPFKEMEVGDSFEFNRVDHHNLSATASVAKKNGLLPKEWKFVVRSVSDTRARCWRVA